MASLPPAIKTALAGVLNNWQVSKSSRQFLVLIVILRILPSGTLLPSLHTIFSWSLETNLLQEWLTGFLNASYPKPTFNSGSSVFRLSKRYLHPPSGSCGNLRVIFGTSFFLTTHSQLIIISCPFHLLVFLRSSYSPSPIVPTIPSILHIYDYKHKSSNAIFL